MNCEKSLNGNVKLMTIRTVFLIQSCFVLYQYQKQFKTVFFKMNDFVK